MSPRARAVAAAAGRPPGRAARRGALVAALAALVAGGAACSGPPETTMVEQVRPEDRPPWPAPAGAVPRERPAGEPGLVAGGAGPATVGALPLAVTDELLAEGERRFAAHCAPCHGPRGDGETLAATRMRRRRPPSLHEAGRPGRPPGFVYRVVARGHGLMPALGGRLTVAERWAIVAFVRDLPRRAAAWSRP